LSGRGSGGNLNGMGTPAPRQWKYLEPRPGSAYRQLFIKGRHIKALDLFDWYDPEGDPKLTAEDLAKDFDLPVEAVREAIAYCESNPPEIEQDYQLDEAVAEASGMNHPDPQGPPPRHSKPISPQEWAKIHRQFDGP
jgi:uncharacterized protein (DUF433 family)